VESGTLAPGRAIDLGCGTGDNVIYLAQQGFEATGVDISPRAIARAQRRAHTAGVSPTFLVADVTDLTEVEGPFDLVVDNGCLHSLIADEARAAYMNTLTRLTRPGCDYFLRVFIREPGGLFHWIPSMSREEISRRFNRAFDVVTHESGPGEVPLGLADATDVYRMRRKENRRVPS
jgi:2-polyprenyl-3-methyl-5-hydroxy-6-metoxy-1,4-benzoquinol methylase